MVELNPSPDAPYPWVERGAWDWFKWLVTALVPMGLRVEPGPGSWWCIGVRYEPQSMPPK